MLGGTSPPCAAFQSFAFASRDSANSDQLEEDPLMTLSRIGQAPTHSSETHRSREPPHVTFLLFTPATEEGVYSYELQERQPQPG